MVSPFLEDILSTDCAYARNSPGVLHNPIFLSLSLYAKLNIVRLFPRTRPSILLLLKQFPFNICYSGLVTGSY